MYKQTARYICVVVLSFIICTQADAARNTRKQRKNVEDRQTTGSASKDIKQKLDTVLNSVNSGKKLQPEDISTVKKTLLETKKYLPDLSKDSQCEYYLLSAWANYYAGRLKPAMQDSKKALMANENNIDAKATQLAMAILNKDFQGVTKLYNTKASAFKPEQTPTNSRSSRRRSAETLDIEITSIQPKLLGKPIETLKLKCLNGTDFTYKPGKTALCILFWKLQPDKKTNAQDAEISPDMGFPMPESTQPRNRRSARQQGSSKTQDAAFAQLFRAEIENQKVQFLAVNLDDIADKQKVIEHLFEQSWPWAQAMADNAENAALNEFKNLKLTQPSLAIAGTDGRICYAGQASGFLPPIVLSQTISETATGTRPTQPLPEPIPEINEPMENEPTENEPPTPEPETSEQPNEPEEEFNPHAEQLYNTAASFKTVGAHINYRSMVDICRTILQQYPDTQYAEKARGLLREMPTRFRKMYKITDEELGL